jgi:hypothetical protein
MTTMDKKTINKIYFSIVTIFVFIIIFVTITISAHGIDSNQSNAVVAYAQMNPLNGNSISNTTMIGNITIPYTNDTATTSVTNATGTNATGIHKELLAQNITSANKLTKENTTTPISPTGISTQAQRAPPSNRLVNNTVSTTDALNTNMTRGGAMTSSSSVGNNNMTGNNNNTGISRDLTTGSAANMSGNNIASQGAATSADQQQSKNDTGNPLTDIGKKIGDLFGQGSSK